MSTMSSNLPVFKTCIFCVPLRTGLMAWGCFKTVICTLIASGLCYLLLEAARVAQIKDERYRVLPEIVLFICVLCVVAIVDVIMNVLLFVACKKANIKVLKSYYTYCKFTVVLAVGWWIFYTFMTIYAMFSNENYKYVSLWFVMSELMDVMTYFSLAAVHFYVLLLARSQILQLENENSKSQNNTTDPESTMQVKDTETD